MMFAKLRWSLMAIAMVMVGALSTAYAADEMENSFDAAESGDFKEAVTIWEKLAKKGDPQAQFNLGLMYHGGLGLPRDEKEAVTWYQKAAEGGYSPAQVYLVVGYEEGWFGLPKDKKQAKKWKKRLESGK